MPLKAAYWLLNAVLLPKYYTHALFAVAALVTLYTYAQGRKTNRERDLHARTILITVASCLPFMSDSAANFLSNTRRGRLLR